jgi:hypothetical protein
VIETPVEVSHSFLEEMTVPTRLVPRTRWGRRGFGAERDSRTGARQRPDARRTIMRDLAVRSSQRVSAAEVADFVTLTKAVAYAIRTGRAGS